MRILLLLLFFGSGGLGQPFPPAQATGGPGGTDYPHRRMETHGPFWPEERFLDDSYRYYLFEPSGPRPRSAPAVLFLHGFRVFDPRAYLGWIEHVVRKGYTVVWVQYDGGWSLPRRFPDHAEEAWLDALGRLGSAGHVPVLKDERGIPETAFVGHSLGAWLSALLASDAGGRRESLPPPRAVMGFEPGGRILIPRRDLSGMDPSTQIVLVVGEEDRLACMRAARFIWRSTSHIPDRQRDFLVVRTDRRGSPPLVADHRFPAAVPDSGTIDSLDFFGTFKLTTGLLNCAFRSRECEFALGGGAGPQISMGRWSDGTPVAPIQWIEDPLSFEARCRLGGKRDRVGQY